MQLSKSFLKSPEKLFFKKVSPVGCGAKPHKNVSKALKGHGGKQEFSPIFLRSKNAKKRVTNRTISFNKDSRNKVIFRKKPPNYLLPETVYSLLNALVFCGEEACALFFEINFGVQFPEKST